MWIFCCGMYRSGSTLQFQITVRLVEEAGLGKRVEWVKTESFPELCEKYADYDGWKVFKAHVCTDAMVSEFTHQNAIGIYVFRDPRDVFVSTMRKSSKTFDEVWRGDLLERCLDNYQCWTSLPRVLVSKYEEMIPDLPGEVERIAVHLGISLDRKQCEQIASNYTINRQIERIEESKRTGSFQQGYVNGPLFDPHTLLHTNHIHSGEMGGWKGVLIPKQVALIESKAQDWLIANGYELTNPQLNLFQRILLRFR